MNLTEIRLEVYDLLDDEKGESFSVERVTRAIDRAYKDVVTFVEKIPEAWNVRRTPQLYALAAGSDREWSLSAAQPLCRGVLDVADWDTDNLVPQARRRIIPWAERNTAGHSDRDCYVFRDELGHWYMGTVQKLRTELVNLAVWFRTPIGRLWGSNDEPLLLPEDHQSVISAKAALLLLQQINRDPGLVPALYMERLAQLKEHIVDTMQPSRHKRLRGM